MNTKFYILARMREGVFGEELIDEIVRIQTKPFIDTEIYELIKDNYVNEGEDEYIQKYVQSDGGVIWFIRSRQDDFTPGYDDWYEASSAFWVVEHNQ